MWKLDHKEGWALKSWCFQTVVLEKTLESPQTARRSNQSVLKEVNLDYLLEGLKLIWPADAKGPLIGKDPDAGKDWGQEEKGATEDETVGWHYWRNGLEFEQTPGGCEGLGSLECCSPWGHKESDMAWLLNNSNNNNNKPVTDSKPANSLCKIS